MSSDSAAPEIEILVEDVCKIFDGHAVLKGVDLGIERGEMVAVVGGSGCGKTVLLNHILGQLAPDRGCIRVADHQRPGGPLRDLAELSAKELDELHQHWGVVFQPNALFSGTVYDNIALWLREVKRLGERNIAPIARTVLQAVNLPCDDDFLGLDHESLSGGMQKRLAVARALAMDPKVMFYDEPTTGLDPTSASQVQDVIHATHLAGRRDDWIRTTFIITHDKDLLMRLRPRIVMLHDGRVYFDGSFDAFHSSLDSAIIRPYFELMPLLHEAESPRRAGSVSLTSGGVD